MTVSHVRNLYDGLTMREDAANIFEPLAKFYKKEVERQYENGAIPGMVIEPEVPAQLLEEAKQKADVAVIVISRFSGEGWDRQSVEYEGATPGELEQSRQNNKIFENGDYCLTVREQAMVDAVCEKGSDFFRTVGMAGRHGGRTCDGGYSAGGKMPFRKAAGYVSLRP